MPSHRRTSANSSGRKRPFWSIVLLALREARGVTQEGWAAYLDVSRATVGRWEAGVIPPDEAAETALIALCKGSRLFRPYDHGRLAGQTVTPEWLGSLLAEARLDGRPRETMAPAAAIVAPVATRPVRSARLPAVLTSLVDREEEVHDIVSMLERHDVRLLTICGTGGVGKTRLALEVGHALRNRMADGIWYVSLESVREIAGVLPAIMTSLEIADQASRTRMDVLASYLEERQGLLVLDNFEQIVGAAADITALLTACPLLKVLVTSRMPLDVRGEHIFDLLPLLTPPVHEVVEEAVEREVEDSVSPDALLNYPSVALFVQRATAASRTFRLTDRNAAAVAEISARLDGLPLAIELVAVRVRGLTAETIAGLLEQRFLLLSNGPRDMPDRHQSLRAVFDWSHDLLTEAEQALFRRLSVFDGGWTDAAMARVTDLSGDVRDPGPMGRNRLIDELARQSLVIVEERDGTPRYRMLETIRAYAAERLELAGERDLMRERHYQWCLLLAETPRPERAENAQPTWRAGLAAEMSNFRAALVWCAAATRNTEGLALSAALGPLWQDLGFLREGATWLTRFLDLTPARPTRVRAAAGYYAARLAWEQPDLDLAARLAADSRDLSRQIEDHRGEARAQLLLGRVQVIRGNIDDGVRLLEETRALFRQSSEWRGEAEALHRTAYALVQGGRYDEAADAARRSLRLFQQHDDPSGSFDPLWNLAAIANGRREFAEAERLLREALDVARMGHWDRNIADALTFLGLIHLNQGAFDDAVDCITPALDIYAARGAQAGVVTALVRLARALVGRGEAQRATLLFGAIDTLETRLRRTGMRLPSARENFEVEHARKLLGDPLFRQCWETGRSMTFRRLMQEVVHGPTRT